MKRSLELFFVFILLSGSEILFASNQKCPADVKTRLKKYVEADKLENVSQRLCPDFLSNRAFDQPANCFIKSKNGFYTKFLAGKPEISNEDIIYACGGVSKPEKILSCIARGLLSGNSFRDSAWTCWHSIEGIVPGR
ncbi:MAG: hypothetical protein JXA66_08485 [Oligoflexia bacterium]|nr:hypothetical protein [Oligoflexia bacterium]